MANCADAEIARFVLESLDENFEIWATAFTRHLTIFPAPFELEKHLKIPLENHF
jgi:hypothetical protein